MGFACIAVHGRALRADELARQGRAAQAHVADRRTPEGTVRRLELVARVEVPKPDAYPNTLAVFEHAVLDGENAGTRLLVAWRANWNGLRDPRIDALRVGDVRTVRLEPFDQHPELTGVQTVQDETRLGLPLFYAAGVPEDS